MTQKLPTERAFDPYNDDLNAQSAWKNFGGLGIDEAYEKFLECPEIYQEDFMFMRWPAFKFYCPVIEKYLKEAIPDDETDDCAAWILGCGVENQIRENREKIRGGFNIRLEELCRAVIKRYPELNLTPKTIKRILKQWKIVKKELELTRR